MKLAIIRQRYNPYGGAERFVARAAGALAAEGVGVTVVAREWRDGGDVATLRCDPFYLGRLWRDWGFARAACAAVALEDFDLVQSHERLSCCDVYRAGDGVHRQWLENRGRAIGAAARVATALNPYHRYVLAAEARMFASPRLRAVICNSRMVANEIRRHFGVPDDKLHIVYNGVDTEAFNPRLRVEFRAMMRAKLRIPDLAPVVLYVGSGFERKGVPRLLEAFARMPERDARLLVVGRDKSASKLARRVRALGLGGRVVFAGGQQDVRPWYGAADLFALPTLYDPFPNAALEALACALPVITSTQCGAAELIVEGVNGHVRDALDVDGLAGALTNAVRNLRTAEAAAAARRAAEGLDLATMAARLAGLYRQLLHVPVRG